MAEMFQQPFHQFVAARISLFMVADKCEGVCEVAASPACDCNFGQHSGVFLENGDFSIGGASFGFDGGEIACCATADDGDA